MSHGYVAFYICCYTENRANISFTLRAKILFKNFCAGDTP